MGGEKTYGNYASPSNSNGIYESFLDINGDGILDRVLHYNQQTKQHGIWVALGTNRGFRNFIFWKDFRNMGGDNSSSNAGNYPAPSTSYGTYEIFLDANADNLPDRVIHYNYQTSQYGVHLSLNNGNQDFEPFRLWKDFRNIGGYPGSGGNYPIPSDSAGIYETFLDMNGDEFPDRVIHKNFQNSQHGVHVALSNRNGDFEPFRLWKDFRNMGGKETHGNYPTWSNSNGILETFLDMNGDGLPDRVIHYNYQTSKSGIYVALNQGDNFEEFVFWKDFSSIGGNPTGQYGNKPAPSDSNGTYETFLDINGDGLLDRVIHKNYQTNKEGIHVALGTGRGFKDFVFWKNFRNVGGNTSYGNYPSASNSNGTYESFLDMNNDGLPDRVIHNNYQTGQSGVHVALNKASSPRLTSIQTPLGTTFEIKEALSSNLGEAIAMEATSCGGGEEVGYGRVCGIPNTQGRYLVTALHTQNGRDQRLTKRYEYYNGRMYPGQIQVQKDLGFEWMKETDEQTGISIQTFFRQDKPFHGQVARIEKKDINENLLQQEIHSFVEIQPTTYTEVKLILAKQKQVSLFERGNLKSQTQIDSTHDAYGFLTQTKTTNGTHTTFQ